MKKLKVAVVGATGVVGHELLNTLYERNFPVSEVIALASDRSAGQDVSFGEATLRVKPLKDFDFTGVNIALASAGGDVSLDFAPKAAKAGCVVIDNSSAWRMDPDVPLIVPEVNPKALSDYKKKNIIANPNCSTIQMVVALKPLHDIVPIKRVVVTTFQSVSGAGKAAMDELFNQTKGIYMNQDTKNEEFSKQIAFNVIPQIDRFMDDRMTKEEWKMVAETKKIIDPKIKVCANCVRVPVFVGHSMMVNVEFEGELTLAEAKKAWRTAKGLTYIDLESDLEYITPVEVQGEDNVYVSRLRDDPSADNALNFWCVADNLRKGAALNAIQIAELLAKEY